MTDESSAHARDALGEQEQPGAAPTVSGGPAPSSPSGDMVAPAAHGPSGGAVSASTGIAVLESQPLLGFPGESGATRLGPVRDSFPEPPPFGFNAPRPEVGEGSAAAPRPFAWPSSPSAASAPAEADEDIERPDTPADAAPPFPAPRAAAPPALPPMPRATVPPRELMPTSIPVYRPRLGEGSTPTFGPPGHRRSVAAMVLLSVITLGFYAVAWLRRVNQEMGDFDPRVHVEPSRSAWAVALPLLAGLLASGAAAAVVLLGHFAPSVQLPVSPDQAVYGLAAIAVVPYLVLVLPFSVVAVAMTAERVRVVQEHAGITADEQMRPATVVGCLLLPVVGGFVAMGRQQRCLNRIWDLARE